MSSIGAIRCGMLIDGTGAPPRHDVVIDFAGDRIATVAPSDEVAPPSGAVHDWSEFTIVPGLVDSHDHLILNPGDEVAQFHEGDEATLHRGETNASRILHSGITTLRDCGGWHHLDLAMRTRIDCGSVEGPRTLVSGVPLTITGGHLSIWGGGVSTFKAMRKAVRSQVAAGADFIKIFVTGGLYQDDDKRLRAAFSPDALRVIIDEAHAAGRRVIAHCHGGPGALAAVEAGVDSIEHGIYCTREDFDAMAERTTPLVVTYNVFDQAAADTSLAADLRAKFRNAVETYHSTLTIVRDAKVTVGIGSDTIHTDLVSEMQALIRAGFSNLEVLQAATVNGAHVCGLTAVGTVAAGKQADLVAVRGDPLRDINVLRTVSHVVKGGQLVF
jgi:imidazolonepropionase-like amidohydrolase